MSSGRFHPLGVHAPPKFPSREIRAFIPDAVTPGPDTPVLYVFDGQNAFSDPHAPHGGWRLDIALAALSRSTHSVPVVIAIDHSPERMTELCPWRDGGGWGGGGDTVLEWLLQTLAPHVQRELGLGSGPVKTALGGTSMGGLLALYGHLKHPGEIGGALSLSPSFWPADCAALRVLPSLPTPAISRVYLDCGGREASGRMMALVSKMAAHLATRYAPEQLRYVEDLDADHTELQWARRLPEALRFMYRES